MVERYIAVGDEINTDLNIRDEARDKPDADVFDEPVRCYVMNREWAKHFVGAISALAEWRAWTGDMDDRNEAVQQVQKFLAQEENCMSFELRQNPLNPCQLQQTFDGGEIWTLAFDYSLCQSSTLQTSAYELAQQNLEDLLDAYDDTVASVAPSMVYDSSSDDDIRDLALCHALHELIEAMCQAELEYRRQIATSAQLTGIFLAILGVIITVATSGTGTPFYLGIAATIAGGFGTAFGALSLLILDDQTAKEDVQCCMYSALSGATITQTAFEESLDNCGFTGGSNEAQLAGAIVEMLEQENIYVTFLDLMERSYNFAELDLVQCDCDTLGAPTESFDFTTGQHSWYIYDDPVNPPRGVYDTGEGFNHLFGGTRYRLCIGYDFSGEEDVYRVEFDVDFVTAGNTNVVNLYDEIITTPSFSLGTLIENKDITNDGIQTLVYTTPFTSDKIAFNCADGTQNETGIEGQITVTGIRIWY